MDFSILNESSLHRSLKKLYAAHTNGKTEVKLCNYIYDIITQDGEIIEIQTGNLNKIRNKIIDSTAAGKRIKIVYPLVINKKIITRKIDGTITERKSPKKGTIYTVIKELTGIYDLLLNPLFSLEIIEVNISELREETEEKIQSKNKQRRFKKNWIKSGKKLDSILNTQTFSHKEDYLKLLPPSLPEEFSSLEIIENITPKSKNSINNVNLLLWLLNHMNLIIYTQKKSKRKYYKFS